MTFATKDLTKRFSRFVTILLAITLGVSVHAFAAPFAFLANSDVKSIDILDIASRSVIAQVPLELTPTAIAINRHNTAAFITS